MFAVIQLVYILLNRILCSEISLSLNALWKLDPSCEFGYNPEIIAVKMLANITLKYHSYLTLLKMSFARFKLLTIFFLFLNLKFFIMSS